MTETTTATNADDNAQLYIYILLQNLAIIQFIYRLEELPQAEYVKRKFNRK